MFADEVTENPTETPKKKKKPRGIPFNSETGKAHAKKAVWAKKVFAARRKELKQAVFEKVSPEYFATKFVEALDNLDDKQMNAFVEAAKFVGVHFDQSEECIKNLNINAKNEVKGNVTTKLIIEDLTKDDVENG